MPRPVPASPTRYADRGAFSRPQDARSARMGGRPARGRRACYAPRESREIGGLVRRAHGPSSTPVAHDVRREVLLDGEIIAGDGSLGFQAMPSRQPVRAQHRRRLRPESRTQQQVIFRAFAAFRLTIAHRARTFVSERRTMQRDRRCWSHRRSLLPPRYELNGDPRTVPRARKRTPLDDGTTVSKPNGFGTLLVEFSTRSRQPVHATR
jgi:hypothetical protein